MAEEWSAEQLYARLCAKFTETHELPKAGGIEYLATEQVVSRLNQVLGVEGWSFEILRDGRDDETVWCVGQLTAHFVEHAVVRQQYGECKIERGMGVGDCRKGAGSDALKKCATLIGVGLYLTEKEVPHQVRQAQQQQANQPKQTHPNGLLTAAADPMTDGRRAHFLAKIKELDAEEQDFVFSAGRSVEEWCAQNQTGYGGAAQAYVWFKTGKTHDSLGKPVMIGANKPRAAQERDSL